jgi:hypothetical protein
VTATPYATPIPAPTYGAASKAFNANSPLGANNYPQTTQDWVNYYTHINKPQLAMAAAALQYDPQTAYQQYVSSVQQQADAYSGIQDINIQPLGFQDWMDNASKNMGTYGVVNLLKLQYESDTGQVMSQKLYGQLLTALNQSPQSVKDELQGAAMQGIAAGSFTQLSSITNKLGYLQNLLYTATGGVSGAQAALTPAQRRRQSLEDSVANQFQQTTGRVPTQAEINQMASMNSIDLQKFLDAQPYKNGLTVGQWTDAMGRITKYYQQYFGRKPTDQEITWASGKSDDQIQEHIMQSPSRVSGLNMGQYTSYKSALDTVMQNTYGYEAPDSLIKDFHHASQQPSVVKPQ